MAASGEERLLTLFADVHYYFSEPAPRPVHHRFDKESYVYLYRDTAHRRGRLEIANHAGTPEQDAFTGYLDASKISQTSKHPTLVTVVVDGIKGAAPAQTNDHHWRLPSTDPRDEGKYLFRLHTVDIYFWTVDDANSFIRGAQQALPSQQLDIQPPPQATPQHSGAMSPVVQNLENMAVSDPKYGSPEPRPARSSQAQQGGRNGTPSSAHTPAPPPPSSPPSQQQPSQQQAPLAYNPAAPAAPEVHAHREKTPPPPEAGAVGTGLAAAAYNDHVQHQHNAPNSFPPPPPGSSYAPTSTTHSPYASPPPSQFGSPPPASSYTSPPPSHLGSPSPNSQQLSRPLSHAAQTYTPASPPPGTSTSPLSSGIGSPGDPNAHFYGNPPLDSPTAQILGAGPPQQRQPLAHLQPQYVDYISSRPTSQGPSPTHPGASQPPAAVQSKPSKPGQPPVGGYANYSYDPAAQQQQQQHHHHHHSSSGHNPYGTGDHNIHSQVYRPTEDEARVGRRSSIGKNSWGAGTGEQGSGPGAPNGGKWEGRAEKAEKGINRFLRKVEKKIG